MECKERFGSKCILGHIRLVIYIKVTKKSVAEACWWLLDLGFMMCRCGSKIMQNINVPDKKKMYVILMGLCFNHTSRCDQSVVM